MRHVIKRIGTIAIGVSLLSVACDDDKAPKASPAVTGSVVMEPAGQVPEALPRRAPRQRAGRPTQGGPTALINKALKVLDLADDQKTKLRDLLKPLMPSSEAKKELRAALAAGVRANKLDDELIEEKVAAVEKVAAAAHAKAIEAVNTLHATLTPGQREALVESMRAKSQRRMPADWLETDVDPLGASSRRAMVRRGASASWGSLTRGLGLSPEQRKKVRDAVKVALEARRQRIYDMMDAFVVAEFDAESHAAADSESMLKEMLANRIGVVRTLIDIVDAKQRDKLANNLEAAGGIQRRNRNKLTRPTGSSH
jgi:Spy/CpxP family protein refolding chaperone